MGIGKALLGLGITTFVGLGIAQVWRQIKKKLSAINDHLWDLEKQVGITQINLEAEQDRQDTIVEAIKQIEKVVAHPINACDPTRSSHRLALRAFKSLDRYIWEVECRVKKLEEHTERVEDLEQYDSRLEGLEQTIGILKEHLRHHRKTLNDHGLAVYLLVERVGLTNELAGALQRAG